VKVMISDYKIHFYAMAAFEIFLRG